MSVPLNLSGKKIDPIPLRCQPCKVWKHLYDHYEYWDRVCEDDVSSLRKNVEEHLGYKRKMNRELKYPINENTKLLLIAHHDEVYSKIYFAEMRLPETQWGRSSKSDRHLALSPRSIFMVIEASQVQNQVITAFRPHPETKNVSFDEDDMQKYGQDYFEKKVIMCDSKYTTSLQQNLQKVTTVPETVQELWRLTSVLGYARGRSELLTEFSRVERLFQQTSQALKVELRNALDWSSLESRLVEAIKELDSEELEDVLIKAEELLITGERLGERSAIDDFLKETQHLLPWLTIESAHVSKLARQRLLALGTCSEYATQLWSAVEDALNVVIMRADEATIRPMSTIAQTLFPEESFWHPILLKLKEIVNPISARCATWVNECSQMLEILPLSPVMGHAEMREEIFGVYGKLGATPPTHYKVFVVSADAPNGYDVTEFFMSSDALLWKTKNQEEVLVVIIAAEAPLEVQNLSELDQLTTQRGDLAWSTRVLKRSMQ